MGGFLEGWRRWRRRDARDRSDAATDVPAPTASAPPPEADPLRSLDAREARGGGRAGFLLAVDEGGELFVLGEERVLLGHAGQPDVALGFLADVEPRIAAIEWRTSLRDGDGWWLVPLGDRVRRNGALPPAEGQPLVDGDRVRCAHNLELRVSAPDPASATILFELEGAAERHGTRRVALFAEGKGGRLSIGPSRMRHVPVRGLALEVALIRRGGKLVVDAERRPAEETRSAIEHYALTFPPRERTDLSLGRPRGSRPPFGIAIVPLPGPEHGA